MNWVVGAWYMVGTYVIRTLQYSLQRFLCFSNSLHQMKQNSCPMTLGCCLAVTPFYWQPMLLHSVVGIECFWYTVRVKKNDADIRNAFPKCVCSAAPAANWKASSANRKASSGNWRFLPKKRKASSEERWVWTHISFRNTVQLHLRIFRGCVCIFRSCVNNGKAEQQWKGFRKRASFLKTRTVLCHYTMLLPLFACSVVGTLCYWSNCAVWRLNLG